MRSKKPFFGASMTVDESVAAANLGAAQKHRSHARLTEFCCLSIFYDLQGWTSQRSVYREHLLSSS